MLAVLGILISALSGILLVGYSYAANTANWGAFSSAQIPFYAGLLLIGLAGMGVFYKVLNR